MYMHAHQNFIYAWGPRAVFICLCYLFHFTNHESQDIPHTHSPLAFETVYVCILPPSYCFSRAHTEWRNAYTMYCSSIHVHVHDMYVCGGGGFVIHVRTLCIQVNY